MKKIKYSWWLTVKLRMLCYGGNSWIVALRQIKFGTVMDHVHAYKFLRLDHYFVWRSFWIWRWREIFMLCWDKHWTTARIILKCYAVLHLCKLFNLLLNCIQLFCSWHHVIVILKPPVHFMVARNILKYILQNFQLSEQVSLLNVFCILVIAARKKSRGHSLYYL
jgi:hypothetical protein